MNILELLSAKEIDTSIALTRLLVALVAGGLIGAEREMRRQVAGLRTHILISIGSCLLMMLSIWMPQTIALDKGDPGRIAAQVVSGIGFLGAGAFIKIGNNVKGMTTAASLWVVAAIGLTIGAGMWRSSLIALGLVLFALALLEPLERKIFPAERFKYVSIWFAESTMDRKMVYKVLCDHGIKIQSVDASMDIGKGSTKLTYLAKIPIALNIESLFKELRKIGDVEKVKIEENL